MKRRTIDPRVRATVIELYGNDCWLHLPGCTGRGEEDDHIIPYHAGGRDTVANIRRACKHCNASRQDRVLYGYGARLHMLVVPPGSCDREAMDWLDAHARTGDPVISFPLLAKGMRLDNANLTLGQRRAVAMAWSAAYRQYAKCTEPLDVWCVRTMPNSRAHPRMIEEWLALDYDITVIDPGFDVEWARARTEQSRILVRQWYALHLSQSLMDARKHERHQQLVRLGLAADDANGPTARVRW